MTITVLDPTAAAEGPDVCEAAGLASLSGRTIGLLDNSKFNVTPFLDHVEQILRAEYRVRDVVRRRKHDASRPCPPETMRELTACDAVISGVGD
jgi:hypothetical protein